MTVHFLCPTRPCQQQQNAINVLNSMIINGTIYVDKVDSYGFVTSLDITGTTVSALPPDFGSLFPEVNKLRLDTCRKLTDISSIGGMRKLRELCLYMCPALRAFPDELCERLKKLGLEHCNAFDYDSSNIRNLEGLEEFVFVDHDIDQVPLEVWSLSNLKRLHLIGDALTAIPKQIGNLTHLEDLRIDGKNITSISREIGALVHLKKIRLYLEEITELPDEMGALTAIESADISGCFKLKRIPASFLQLPRLEHLDLSFCHDLSIPNKDVLECTDSLVEVVCENEQEDFSSDEEVWFQQEAYRGVREYLNLSPELLHYMARLNNNGRYLLKAKEIPLAVWGVVLGRCSNNNDANSLFFFLKEKPDVIPANSRKRRVVNL